ncbi:MAG: hypothetical protein GY832_13945 [Chloroflexi bacterium]|nr:hypothetical protein [Chloroflexota bacterium]
MNRKVKVRIYCERRSDLIILLALALSIMAGLGYLAWGQSEVAASGSPAPLASSAGMRQYYLTTTNYTGGNADEIDACTDGYHFASLWEILNPANLKYNTVLGYNREDSGQGPPSYIEGWIRTGYSSSDDNTPGLGNCSAWDSSDGAQYGTTIRLPNDWDVATDIHVWDASAYSCAFPLRVWCVADNVGNPVYLPLVVRNT